MMSAPSWDQMWSGTVDAFAALAAGETPVVLKPWNGPLEAAEIYDDMRVELLLADLEDVELPWIAS